MIPLVIKCWYQEHFSDDIHKGWGRHICRYKSKKKSLLSRSLLELFIYSPSPLMYMGILHFPPLWKIDMATWLSLDNKMWVEVTNRGFPCGTVVGNPPANTGDTRSIPGPGRSHMLWSSWACAPQLLSLCSRACEPPLVSPRATTTEACTPRARALQQEKPPQWEARALQWRVTLACCN